MGSRDSFHSTRYDTLEPLDVIGLPPPFHNLEHTPSLSDGTVLEETPTTATLSLPTPGHPPPSPGVLDFVDHSDHQPFQYAVFPADWDQPPPSAPRLKDLDSFTEGTGVGSFDFSLRSSCSSEHLSGRPYLDAPTIRSSHSNEHLLGGPHSDAPAHEIEMWRDAVLLSTSSAPPLPTCPEEDVVREESAPPNANPSWLQNHTRPPKRQLSSTSLDGNYKRGRKLTRHGLMPRLLSVSPVGTSRVQEAEIDPDLPARSSSLPDFR